MRERGSSLIEVLIASAIVITALVALAQLFVVAITANQRAKTRTQATVLAQERIEELLEEQAAVASGPTISMEAATQWAAAVRSPSGPYS